MPVARRARRARHPPRRRPPPHRSARRAARPARHLDPRALRRERTRLTSAFGDGRRDRAARRRRSPRPPAADRARARRRDPPPAGRPGPASCAWCSRHAQIGARVAPATDATSTGSVRRAAASRSSSAAVSSSTPGDLHPRTRRARCGSGRTGRTGSASGAVGASDREPHLRRLGDQRRPRSAALRVDGRSRRGTARTTRASRSSARCTGSAAFGMRRCRPAPPDRGPGRARRGSRAARPTPAGARTAARRSRSPTSR